MVVSGYDETPTAGNFTCDFPVGVSWTVDNLALPTSGPDSARTDASYLSNTFDDRNAGAHGIQIPVLANDDDPEVPGGVGNIQQVRIRDWQPLSVLGGTVSCGNPAQKGTAAFQAMSFSPCLYTPPQNTAFGAEDSFSYLLRSVSGKQRFVVVTIDLLDNSAPVGGANDFSTLINTADTFQLAPFDPEGDPVRCVGKPIVAAPNGSGVLNPDCSFTFAANPSTGTKSFSYRTCDTHPLLINGEFGAIGGSEIAHAAGYTEISPDDLNLTESQRCADLQATVNVLAGVQLPPNAGTDNDSVDSGYSGDDIGPYTLEIPVRLNDVDNNGVDPSDPTFNGVIQILDGPAVSEGTASVNGDKEVVFTPADGFEGPVQFTYRVCEDPLQQGPTLDR